MRSLDRGDPLGARRQLRGAARCLIAHFTAEDSFVSSAGLVAPSSRLYPSPRGAAPSPPSSLLSLAVSALSIRRLPLLRTLPLHPSNGASMTNRAKRKRSPRRSARGGGDFGGGVSSFVQE